MVLQYCSDLHLEFRENKAFMEAHPLESRGDVLLLAGDVVPFGAMNRYNAFFDDLSRRFQTVYWLPGNHEYYGADVGERSGRLQEEIRPNVFLVNNIVRRHGPLRLVFTTLWSRISEAHEWPIERSMNDFHVIRYQGKRLSAPRFNDLHASCLDFLHDALGTKEEDADGTVVVTHHVPTYLHYPEKYRGSVLSDAFAVELGPLMETYGPDHWIYGHHHCNIPDFSVGRTRLHTNQLGYVQYGENLGFSPDKVLTI
jgi:predicted phosphohydrolase